MSTRKDLARISQGELIRKAEREAEARQAGEEERLRLARADFRIGGVYSLAEYTSVRATALNRLTSHSDPHLQAIHEGIEEAAAIVSINIIYRYGGDR